MSRLHLAIELDGDGAHPAAWRQSGRRPGAVLAPRSVREAAADAEAAGFTVATFADSPVPPGGPPDAAGRLEAGTRAAFVSTTTDRIGLAPTLHVTTTEPFHLATQLASLDHASRGRAGWVVGAANGAADRATIGAAPLTDLALQQEIRDVVDVSRRLWDSWQDDAVIRDVPTGRYLDHERVRHVDFDGAGFTVKGPLITPRPPQGQVVVLAAEGLGIADRADIELLASRDLDRLARQSAAPLRFAEIEVALDTAEPAADRVARLDEATPWRSSGRYRHVGSAAALVELLRALPGVVNGVRLHPAVLAIDLPTLGRLVVPALTAAGLHRPPRRGDTLRQTLGLPRPENSLAGSAP